MQFLSVPDTAAARGQLEAFFSAHPVGVLDVAYEIAGSGQTPAGIVSEVAHAHAAALAAQPGAQIHALLTDVLMSRDVDVALQWLFDIGVLHLLLPELVATVNLVQEEGRQHKDVWAHTKQVVRQTVRRPLVRWAALLHDIGKVPTRTFTNEGVHFHGHAEVGARMFSKIHPRLGFARDERDTVKFLVRHHLRTNQYGEHWTDSAVRRFHREMGPHYLDLLDLSRADITSKRPGRRQFLLHQIHLLETRANQLAEQDAKLPPLPTGVGNAIMDAFAIAPSRLIGDLKRRLEADIENGTLQSRREEAYYVAYLAREALVPGVSPERNAELAQLGGVSAEEAARLDAAPEVDILDEDDDGQPGTRIRPCGHDADNDPCEQDVGAYDS